MSYEYENNEIYLEVKDKDTIKDSKNNTGSKDVLRNELSKFSNSEDTGFVVLKREVKNGSGTKKIPCYSSGGQGTSIRDAVTGARNYSHKVGSINEDYYFKVMICTGEIVGKGSITLFFDSPEEYESHMSQQVDQDIKDNWLKKRGQTDYFLKNVLTTKKRSVR